MRNIELFIFIVIFYLCIGAIMPVLTGEGSIPDLYRSVESITEADIMKEYISLPAWLVKTPLDEIPDEHIKAIPFLWVDRPVYLLSPGDIKRFDREIEAVDQKEIRKYYLMTSYHIDSVTRKVIQPRTTEEVIHREEFFMKEVEESSVLYSVVKLFLPRDIERDVFLGLNTFFGMLGQLLAFKNPYHIEPVFMSTILTTFFWLTMFYIAWDEIRKVVRG